MAIPIDLENKYKQSRMTEIEANRKLGLNRGILVGALQKAGVEERDASALLESFERQVDPEFVMNFGGDTLQNWARQSFEQAMRNGVSKNDFDAYLLSLKEAREGTFYSSKAQNEIFQQGGYGESQRLLKEVDHISEIQAEMIAEATRINPNISVDAVFAMTDLPNGKPSLDPLKNTLKLALDPSVVDPIHEVHKQAWHTLSPLLSNDELRILNQAIEEDCRPGGSLHEYVRGKFNLEPTEAEVQEEIRVAKELDPHFYTNYSENDARTKLFNEKFAAIDKHSLISVAFAEYSAPEETLTGKIKSDTPFLNALKPLDRFVRRSRSFLKGNGFETVEDIFDKAREGRLAAREHKEPGIRLPNKKANPDGYENMKAAIKKMSLQDLTVALREQSKAVKEERNRKTSVFRKVKKVVFAPFKAIRHPIKTMTSVFNPEDQSLRQSDAFVADQDALKLSELTAARALLTKELRDRREQGFAKSMDIAKMGSYTPPPPPSSSRRPLNNPQQEDAALAGAAIAATMAMGIPQIGKHGAMTVEKGMFNVAGLEMPYKVSLQTAGLKTDLAFSQSENEALEFIQAFDRSSPDQVSSDGLKLAEQMDRIGGREAIQFLKSTNMIDPLIDKSIEQASVLAFVYPLKDGTLIYQNGDQWRAGSVKDFAEIAVGNRHLEAALGAIGHEGGKMELRRDGSIGPVSDARHEVSAAVSYSLGGAHDLDDLSDDALKKHYKNALKDKKMNARPLSDVLQALPGERAKIEKSSRQRDQAISLIERALVKRDIDPSLIKGVNEKANSRTKGRGI